jgi:hypothetical protein
MLIHLAQPLDLVNKLFILLALDADHNSKATESKNCRETVILRYGLQVWHIETWSGLLQHIGKVLGHETVETLKGAEPENPVLGWLRWRARGLAKVVRIAIEGRRWVIGFVEAQLTTYTMERTSKSAAPSARSATVVTGRARLKVAKKLKKASISRLCEESDMTVESSSGHGDGRYFVVK